MAAQLYTGELFPGLDLRLAGGGGMKLPGGIDSRFLIAIFYRGHW